jgi:hypothetical protein
MADSRSSSLSELARLGFEALSETVSKLEQLVKLVGDSGHGALSAIYINEGEYSLIKYFKNSFLFDSSAIL